MNRRIVFLYTELAEYIKACMDRLAESGVEVHVFAYPVNPEAPFQFDFESSKCIFYQRNQFSDRQLEAKVSEINPQAIVCSGWIDEGYLSVCRSMRTTVRTILALDTQIESGIKAKVSRFRAKVLFKSAFSDAWVPGEPQVEFARKLGFSSVQISTGFYTADTVKWSGMSPNYTSGKFPKRFVFVGRYLDFKGVNELWEAFEKLGTTQWQLYCAGQGDLFPQRKEIPGIHHLGFVQPSDFDKFVAAGGVFVLPSHREPWGVVLHEFAAAGFPIISSESVGAASAFLKTGENGFTIPAGNVEGLKAAMQKMIDMPDDQLIEMAKVSKKLAAEITVDLWVETALKFIEEEK